MASRLPRRRRRARRTRPCSPPAPGFEAAAVGAQTLRRAAPGGPATTTDVDVLSDVLSDADGASPLRLDPSPPAPVASPYSSSPYPSSSSRNPSPCTARSSPARRPHAVGDAKRHRHGVETASSSASIAAAATREQRSDASTAIARSRPRGRERIGVVHRRPAGCSPPRARRREGAEPRLSATSDLLVDVTAALAPAAASGVNAIPLAAAATASAAATIGNGPRPVIRPRRSANASRRLASSTTGASLAPCPPVCRLCSRPAAFRRPTPPTPDARLASSPPPRVVLVPPPIASRSCGMAAAARATNVAGPSGGTLSSCRNLSLLYTRPSAKTSSWHASATSCTVMGSAFCRSRRTRTRR